MRQPPSVRLDFVAPLHRAPLAGAVLCFAGVAAAVSVGLSFHRALAERRRLEDALNARAQPQRHAAPGPESLKSNAEAAAVERELGIRWTRLLAELEAASHDSASTVSLLHVEPDPAKELVRITAEVRALPDALAYLRRLQRCEVLRHPILESHERRKDRPQHPLLIKLSAEWHT
jgi:hypothetical protein